MPMVCSHEVYGSIPHDNLPSNMVELPCLPFIVGAGGPKKKKSDDSLCNILFPFHLLSIAFQKQFAYNRKNSIKHTI